MQVKNKFVVGMAEIEVAQDQAVYHCFGLGSCISLLLFDQKNNVSGMLHLMLPERFKDKPVEKPGKFADTGIPELLKRMIDTGAEQSEMTAVIIGGACAFQMDSKLSAINDIGSRNSQKVEEMLVDLRIPIIAIDVGGSHGRSITACSMSGRVTIKTIKQGECVLCNMRA